MISAVVLATRRAQRIGEPEFFLPLNGKPALQWLLESALASVLGEIVCVFDDLKSARRQINLVDDKLFWLVNSADRGQSATVITGLWAIHPKSDGVMFLDGDQPFIRKDLIDALIKKFYESSALIVAPSFDGKTRSPILFHRELFPELLKLTGDRRERLLLRGREKFTALVQWKEELSFVRLKDYQDRERVREWV
jgi:molybdenum cofactor cytidylyltransferase